jgi:hypothetical protein
VPNELPASFLLRQADAEAPRRVPRRQVPGDSRPASLEESLGASEDTDDDLIELLAGEQKQSSVDCTAGDLDQGAALGDEA